MCVRVCVASSNHVNNALAGELSAARADEAPTANAIWSSVPGSRCLPPLQKERLLKTPGPGRWEMQGAHGASKGRMGSASWERRAHSSRCAVASPAFHPLRALLVAMSPLRARSLALIACTLVPALAYSPVVLKAQWESSGAFISFSTDMYADMVNDAPRTKGFEQAIQRRLRRRAGECVVLDIGTGPFAILAMFAARAGARKVYAVEANAEAAEQARATVAAAVARGELEPGTIEVIEGFSAAITLPEPADLLVAEISGSIASEEGMCHSIRDARLRHMARPDDPASYIPARCQTVVVPASYSLNHCSATDEAALNDNSWPMHDVEVASASTAAATTAAATTATATSAAATTAAGSAPAASTPAGAGPRPEAEPVYSYRCIQDVHQYVGVGPVRIQSTDPWLLPVLTHASRGLGTVRTSYAYQPPACCTYRGTGQLVPRGTYTVRV